MSRYPHPYDTLRDVTALVQRVLEGHEVHSLVSLGEGTDHRALEVNGAFVARLRKCPDEHTAVAITREIQLLEIVSRVSPIPVPEVVGADPQRGLVVFRLLPGTPLFERPSADPMMLVDPLARFLAAIHALPIREVAHLVERDEYGFGRYLADTAAEMPHVDAHLPGGSRRPVEAFLAASPPAESHTVAFCHNDLGAEHLLASHNSTALTGIVDWSDAAVADPARDVGLLLRDLGPQVAEAVVRQIGTAGSDDVLMRARFYARCKLIEDLAYGLRTSHHRHAERALAHLERTFEEY